MKKIVNNFHVNLEKTNTGFGSTQLRKLIYLRVTKIQKIIIIRILTDNLFVLKIKSF